MVNGKKNSAMKKRVIFGILAAFAVCSCQVEEINETAKESTLEVIKEVKVFTAIIEDTTTPETRTSLDAEGNVLWKQGDQVSIFAGSTVNEQYQVTDASDGKTAASLNKVGDSGFVAGKERWFLCYQRHNTSRNPDLCRRQLWQWSIPDGSRYWFHR